MNDTIANIATSLGVGAISIIRVSGNESINVVNKIFKGINLNKVSSHTIHYGHIFYNNQVIDEVLVSVMKGPKTYTREDVVEINCHGGIATTNKVLEILLLEGCRLAERGEFTKRAFLNGRIDLVEAEAVSDLINSETDLERQFAINNLQGNLSTLIKKLREELINIISNIEVNIDYPEYNDIYEVTINDIKKIIPNIKNQLEKIVNNYESSKLLYKGINVAIIGRPNVGKSSLLNKLLNQERAIVTNIPGTTRDIVEGQIYLDDIKLNIIDTAGIRETNDIVESIGVKKSLKILEEANLILLLLNNNENLNDEDKKLLEITKDKTTIIVINKNDLEEKIDKNLIDNKNIISINTIENESIEILKKEIKKLFNIDAIKNNDNFYAINIRQLTKIKEALNLIKELEKDIEITKELDILEINIKEIWNILGYIIGDFYDEELLDNLFLNFCVGK